MGPVCQAFTQLQPAIGLMPICYFQHNTRLSTGHNLPCTMQACSVIARMPVSDQYRVSNHMDLECNPEVPSVVFSPFRVTADPEHIPGTQRVWMWENTQDETAVWISQASRTPSILTHLMQVIS